MGDERNRSRIVSSRRLAFRLEKPRGLIAASDIRRQLTTDIYAVNQVPPESRRIMKSRERNDEKKMGLVTRVRRWPREPDTGEVLISWLMYKMWWEAEYYFLYTSISLKCIYL